MDIPLEATLPLLGVGALTMMLSLVFCCYLWWLRRQGRLEQGYREIKYKRLQKKSNDVCPVCLDEFSVGQKIAICSCEHVFHTKCLQQWLEQSNTCPLCKQRVRVEPGENTRLVRHDVHVEV